jgi:hypothetical protein
MLKQTLINAASGAQQPAGMSDSTDLLKVDRRYRSHAVYWKRSGGRQNFKFPSAELRYVLQLTSHTLYMSRP